jgi:hypothetical protein
MFLFTLFLTGSSSAQEVTKEMAIKIVKEALPKLETAYGEVKFEDGCYELEVKLLYDGIVVSEAEKYVGQSNKTSEKLLSEFKKELKTLLPTAEVSYANYDRDDNEWEIHLRLPGANIKIDEIKVNATTGTITPD